MKKIIILISFLVVTGMVTADNLVQVNFDNKSKLKELYAQNELNIHYVHDKFVIASADKNYSGDFELIDKQCWKKGQAYYIAWFNKGLEQDYLIQIKSIANIAKQTNDYLIINAGENQKIHPPVQGSLVKIGTETTKTPVKNFMYTKGIMELDPEITAMMEEVDTILFVSNLQHLQDYGTRNAYEPQAVEAQNWIKAQYESYGYNVELFDFSMPGGPASDNVIAIKTGTKYPDEYVVIGGHYDSFCYSGDAPGADDDGSGTCGVMEVARVMANFETDRSVIWWVLFCYYRRCV